MGQGLGRPATIPSLVAMVAMGAGTAAAHIGNNFTTYLVGGLMDRFGFNAAQMGVFSMAETLTYALAMLIIAPRAADLSPRGLAVLASALVIAAQAVSVGMSTFAPLVLGRMAAGLGFGLLNGAVNLAAARLPHPARAISAGIAGQTLLFAGINLGLPIVGARYGVVGMFWALAALSAALGMGTLALPGSRETRGITPAPRLPFPWQGWPLLLAMALFATGSLSIWPFMERAAHAIGLSAVEFGRYQSLATLASAAGNTVLVAVVARLPRRWPLLLALLACGLACAGLTTVTLGWAFALALILFNASWFIAYPLLLGLAYSQDASGRLALMTTAVWLLAQSLGALGAGVMATALGSYQIIGPLGLIGCLAALAVAWPLARRADRRSAMVG